MPAHVFAFESTFALNVHLPAESAGNMYASVISHKTMLHRTEGDRDARPSLNLISLEAGGHFAY